LHETNVVLRKLHYLGATKRGKVYEDSYGVLVFANPSSRRLPAARWVELSRWCLFEGKGSAQWPAVRRWLLSEFPYVTTVVSYSDPSVGHTGALYRACNWLWAPTWHRLREPPSGLGSWKTGTRQAVKDRWVFLLQPDTTREQLLSIKDLSIQKRYPWASYREPRWRGQHPLLMTGGGDYQKFKALQAGTALAQG